MITKESKESLNQRVVAKKWMQLCKPINPLSSNLDDELNSIMTKYGEKGWEAFAISNIKSSESISYYVCFKRPVL